MAAVTDTSQLYMWSEKMKKIELICCRGAGEHGQLGIGDLKDRDLPQQVFFEPRNQVASTPGTTIVDISLV